MNNGNDYGQQALERFDHPRNRGPLSDAAGHSRITGPCGDTMEMWIRSDNGRITQATFETDGCGPSIASGSMATELAIGKSLIEAARIQQQDILVALGGLTEESKHCALLAADTLKAAVTDYLERRKAQTPKEDHRGTACDECEKEDCSAKAAQPDESEEQHQERQALQRRLCRIKHKVLVLSGKGGVGKSTFAVNLAVSLSMAGKRVGLLDTDIHGPSVPKMLRLEGTPVESENGVILPFEIGELKVMSIGFFLKNPTDAVIWRGPLKMGIIKQFLKDVEWGELDYLVIDSPPGTGDEPLSVCQLVPDADGAVIITTPQEVALTDVRKCITFCRQLKLPILGVVENMSGLACPKCGYLIEVFKRGGGKTMAQEMNVPFLGAIPLDPAIGLSGDDGRPYSCLGQDSQASRALAKIVQPILNLSVAE